MSNNFPKLHNAAWPGVVGKGEEEPVIELDTMIELTAAAEVDGVKFDGIDLFLSAPHVDIDSSDEDLKKLAAKVSAKNLKIGSVVAPVWPPTGGGSAMGDDEERGKFVEMVEKACVIAKKLGDLGVRDYGIVRIDSAVDPGTWSQDPKGSTEKIAETFRRAAGVAQGFGERLAAEGEICWGGMHSWREMINLLEATDCRGTVGFQADLAHTFLYLLGYNSPEDALLPSGFDWSDKEGFYAAYKKLTDALRPWTIDFHVAQNDATVKGQGSHDKTGRHCLATDPNGKLDITEASGYWMREGGELTKAFRHVCWDGCMFPNSVMSDSKTWNDVLAAMIKVREAHGWVE